MFNFLSLLGWSPGNDDEIFSREALVQAFALEGISGGNAVFNIDKLDWFNQQHIMRLAPDELAARVKPWLVTAGLWHDDYLGDRHAWFLAVLELFTGAECPPCVWTSGSLVHAMRSVLSVLP
jgi:glutamyl/glutaminyl-tRNA synthetase